jgi:hypothetical protein
MESARHRAVAGVPASRGSCRWPPQWGPGVLWSLPLAVWPGVLPRRAEHSVSVELGHYGPGRFRDFVPGPGACSAAAAVNPKSDKVLRAQWQKPPKLERGGKQAAAADYRLYYTDIQPLVKLKAHLQKQEPEPCPPGRRRAGPIRRRLRVMPADDARPQQLDSGSWLADGPGVSK